MTPKRYTPDPKDQLSREEIDRIKGGNKPPPAKRASTNEDPAIEEDFGEEIEVLTITPARTHDEWSTSLKLDEPTLRRIRELGALQCTQREAAAVMLCHFSTFNRFLLKHKEAFDAFESGKELGKASLRRMQFAMAKRSAAMAIWLGKQYLGQRDNSKVEIGGIDGVPLNLENGMAEGLTALLASARSSKNKPQNG